MYQPNCIDYAFVVNYFLFQKGGTMKIYYFIVNNKIFYFLLIQLIAIYTCIITSLLDKKYVWAIMFVACMSVVIENLFVSCVKRIQINNIE